MCLYKILVKNPNIDASRIYLSGASAETGLLNQLLVEKPDLWRGVILLSPSVLPDLSEVHMSSLFIVDGSNDGDALARLTKYQDQAAAEGIRVKLMFLNGAGHITRSTTGYREQLEQLAEFLSDN